MSMKSKVIKNAKKNWQLYILIMIPITLVIVFNYLPIYGLQIAFKNFRASQGIIGSPWVGLDNFMQFFDSYQFGRVIKNTLHLSLYRIFITSPLPVLLALQINYLTNARYRKAIQLITYAPHFISTVVMVGIINMLLNVRTGPLNNLITLMTGEEIDILGDARTFPHLFIWSGVWQNLGFSAVIYIAALAGVNTELHEAAITDGANILRRIWHVDLPHILPTFIMLLVLSMRSILHTDFEKIFLMQNSLNLRASEVISTYTYKVGLVASMPNYGLGAAIGLFNSVVGLVLLLIVNKISDLLTGSSLI